jgi:hypothetical protein
VPLLRKAHFVVVYVEIGVPVDLWLAQNDREQLQVLLKLQILVTGRLTPLALFQNVIALLQLADQLGGPAPALHADKKVLDFHWPLRHPRVKI